MGLLAFKNYLRDGGVSAWKKWVAVAALAYAAVPFDAVPDMIPVLGWLDDVGVLALAATFITREVRRHAAARQGPASNALRAAERA